MKKIFGGLLIMFMSVAIASAQSSQTVKVKMPIDETSKLITYTSVTDVVGINKNDLFNRALSWANKYYKNPNEVIREKDSIEGKIVCKGRYKISNPPDKKGFSSDAGLVQYTLTLQFKDGKFKSVLTAINWKQDSYYPAEKWMDDKSAYYKTEFDFYLEQVNTESNKILSDLKKGASTTTAVKKDDW
jgi:hypothetical protein